MTLKRAPGPALRPFVRRLWMNESGPVADGAREAVLPTGSMHLALRLEGEPFSVDGTAAGRAIVGGTRSSVYVRRPGAGRSVGVQLEPAAAGLLFGVPADELAERHTRLAELWGAEAEELREQLAAFHEPEAILEAMERFLAERVRRIHGIDPAIAHALSLFDRAVPVRDVVETLGWSHRRFIARFRAAVGIPPKRFCRVRRLNRAIRLFTLRPEIALSQLALEAGYSDQPHLNREFLEIAGITPSGYREAAPAAPHHVLLDPPESISSKTGPAART